MPSRRSAVWRLAQALAVLLIASCASERPFIPPPPPIHANGQVLWRIIHDQCVPGQLARGDPAPCALVSPDGFVVLKDRDGATQYLVMPTAKITGIEDPSVLTPQAINYFSAAWGQRHYVDDRLGRPLDRTRVSVAVNSIYGRSQDQLHLHVDCLDASVGTALASVRAPTKGRWRPIRLKGHAYHALWIADDALIATNPFKLLAASIPGARRAMGAWTLALVGARGRGGAPGFYILADRVDPAARDWAEAEELQDHACRT
ncbi:MAG: CDP-diacylglycerol diphosphatase [Caulobacteraceae bacterium]